MSDVTNTFYPGEAITGYGTQLLVSQGGDPPVFAAVADVMTITPGDMTTEVVDITHLRSPEAHREKRPTLRDSGPFALEGNWRPTHGSQSNAGGDGFTGGGLIALWRRRVQTDFQIVVPVGDPGPSFAITGITRTGTVATVVSTAAHGLESGAVVVISGATQAEYNGPHVITVTSTTEFTFDVSSAVATPATGTITAAALSTLIWPFRGVVTKFQPGAIGLEEKIGFSAEITPLSDFSAQLP